jgi:hypothetical protein
MLHARSLRVIGQLLDSARVATFELERHGQYYELWSDALTNADEWHLRKALGDNFSVQSSERYNSKCSGCFSSADISRLDAKGQKKQRNPLFSKMQASRSLSQLLRALGDHLDRHEVSAFHISWAPDSVSLVIFPTGALVIERTTLTAERLQQMSLLMRLRRKNT